MQNTEEIFETVMHWGNEAKYNHSNFPDIITNKDKIRGFFIGTSYKKEENRNNLDLISFLKPITIYSDLFIQNEVFDKAKDITELFKDYSPIRPHIIICVIYKIACQINCIKGDSPCCGVD